MMKEFKKFALRGNVVDLAVGIIIGGAFNSIVSSLVNDVVMPAISVFTGKLDFENLFIALDGETYATLAEAKEKGAATLCYGNFISAVINFLIIAFTVFLFVRGMNKLREKTQKPAPTAAPTTKKCPFCQSEIDIKASRCPHCTSELDLDNHS